MKTLLEIKNLSVNAGNFSVSDVSFSIQENDYLVLLGPTGSGKTILLKTLAGFYPPAKGEIILDGRNISFMPAHKRNIVYLSQHNDLFPHLNVYDNIAFGLRYAGIPKNEIADRVNTYLDIFGLAKFADRDVGTLSGGEGKKVMMARSLAIHPRILLLDEPLGMLDHNARISLLGNLKEVHHKLKLTIIHVSHDRAEALGINEKSAVMNHGRLEQMGETDELFSSPTNRFVAEFLGSNSGIPARDCRTGES